MSETSSKEFESKFEDTMKWKNSKEESAAGSPESKDKERVQQSQKDPSDRDRRTDNGEGSSAATGWRSSDFGNPHGHRLDRFRDRMHRSVSRTHPYGRIGRPPIPHQYYKSYSARSGALRDMGPKSSIGAGGAASRLPRKYYRSGYLGTPDKLYHPGNQSQSLGLNPNMYGYSANISQMFPLIKPSPFCLSPFPMYSTISQHNPIYNPMNCVREKIFINPAKLPELQEQGLDLRVLLQGKYRQPFDLEDLASRNRGSSGSSPAPRELDHRAHSGPKRPPFEKQDHPSDSSARPGKGQQDSEERQAPHWGGDPSPSKEDNQYFDNNPMVTDAADGQPRFPLEPSKDGHELHSVIVSHLDTGATQQHLTSIAGAFPGFHAVELLSDHSSAKVFFKDLDSCVKFRRRYNKTKILDKHISISQPG